MAVSVQGPAPRVVHYVPGEICVVVEAPRAGNAAGWYDAVRGVLNSRIAAHLANPPAWENLSEAVRQDLAPTALRAAFLGRPAVLQPLERGHADVERAVALPAPKRDGTPSAPRVAANESAPVYSDEATPSAVLFYQIGAASDNAKTANSDRREWVRELVNILNALNATAPFSVTDDSGYAGRIVAALPNWLAAGTQSEMTGGGPGSFPLPAGAGQWDIHFPNGVLEGRVEHARKQASASNVSVAVLDTCPHLSAVRKKAKAVGSGHPLNRVAAPGGTGGPGITLAAAAGSEYAHLQHCVANWNTVPTDDTDYEDHFRMADHGLFVAGVIQNLAPWASIRIMRVLNDWGVGDLHALTTALATLAQELAADQERRLVVNLSLMVDQPPPAELFRLLWPTAAKAVPGPDALKADDRMVVTPTLNLADAALARAIGALPPERALIVAAAGNDAVPDQPRPEPRFPARYDSTGPLANVIGVAAIGVDGQPANYSNEADLSTNLRGVAATGGNATRQANGPSAIVVGANGQKDAVVGIFSADTLPITGDKNENGWVYWAGTSFATPIISGIAADCWAAGQSAAAVATAVQGFASVAEPPLLSNGIVVTQAP